MKSFALCAASDSSNINMSMCVIELYRRWYVRITVQETVEVLQIYTTHFYDILGSKKLSILLSVEDYIEI